MPISHTSHRFEPYVRPSTYSNRFDRQAKIIKEDICLDLYEQLQANQCITNKMLANLLIVTGCPDTMGEKRNGTMYRGLKFDDGSFFVKKSSGTNGKCLNELYDADGNIVPE